MCSSAVESSLPPPNNACHPVKLTEEMYHIQAVALHSPCPTSLGVLCRKVCPINNDIQQSVEVTSASKVASCLGHLLTMDETGESVHSCLRFL